MATRRAIYERARKAQLAQLGTPASLFVKLTLPEEEALDQAIALVEAKFGVTGFAPMETSSAGDNSGGGHPTGSSPGPSGRGRNRGLDSPAVRPHRGSFHQERAPRTARRGPYLRLPLCSALFWRLGALRS